jgi:hypothetical protein
MSTVINRRGASAVIHVTANSTVVIAGNSSVSNIAFGGGNSEIEETITNGYISQVWWGASNGYWSVARGANTVLVLNNSGHMDFAGQGAAITQYSSANAVLTLTDSTDGFLMMEIQKLPNITQ